jgi:hypothetical protein
MPCRGKLAQKLAHFLGQASTRKSFPAIFIVAAARGAMHHQDDVDEGRLIPLVDNARVNPAEFIIFPDQ